MYDRVVELEGKGVLPEPDESREEYVERAEDRINAGYELQHRLEDDPAGVIEEWGPRVFLRDDPTPRAYEDTVEWLDDRYDIEPDWVPTMESPLRMAEGFSYSSREGEEFTDYVVVDPYASHLTRRHELLHTTRATSENTTVATTDLVAPWHPFYAAEEVAVDELADRDCTLPWINENERVQMMNLMVGTVTGLTANVFYNVGEQAAAGSPEGILSYGVAGVAGVLAAKSAAGMVSASRMQSALSRFDEEHKKILARLSTDEIHALADTIPDTESADERIAQYLQDQEGLKYEIIADRYLE